MREKPTVADWAGSTFDIAIACNVLLIQILASCFISLRRAFCLRSSDRLNSEATCPICMDPLKSALCVTFTNDGARSCTHVMHMHCARSLMQHSSSTCPMCRTPFDSMVSVGVPDISAKDPVLLPKDVQDLLAAVAGIGRCDSDALDLVNERRNDICARAKESRTVRRERPLPATLTLVG